MGVENLDFSQAPEATDSLLQGTIELFDAEQLLQQIDYASLPEEADKAKRQRQVLLEMIAALLP
jgi:uncharacterized protein YpiB (UPF0302 family)